MAKATVRRTPSDRQLAGEKVLKSAADLFYRKGIRAVGVEEVVAEAGVSKISLYRAYESKDDLILAYLRERNLAFWRNWDDMFDRYRADPREQLRRIMTYVADRTTRSGYRGCPFINYSAEFSDRNHPGHEEAQANKRAMRRRFRDIAKRLGAPHPQRLGDSLLLLVEGAYAISQNLGGADGPGRALVWAAEALVSAEALIAQRDTRNTDLATA